MVVNSIIAELKVPWERDELAQVRTGKAKLVFGIPVQSSMFKSVRYFVVSVDALGCRGDEHVHGFHGDPNQELLQYCSRLYDIRSEELPGRCAPCSGWGARMNTN
jgi:hypothetical protein